MGGGCTPFRWRCRSSSESTFRAESVVLESVDYEVNLRGRPRALRRKDLVRDVRAPPAEVQRPCGGFSPARDVLPRSAGNRPGFVGEPSVAPRRCLPTRVLCLPPRAPRPRELPVVGQPVENHRSVGGFLTQRLTGPRGEFEGVLGISIRVDSFDNLYSTTGLPADTVLNVYRADGSPLFRHPLTADSAPETSSACPFSKPCWRRNRAICLR